MAMLYDGAAKYEGQWCNDKIHGRGVFTWAGNWTQNGDAYEFELGP
jgi:hypothetical protein